MDRRRESWWSEISRERNKRAKGRGMSKYPFILFYIVHRRWQISECNVSIKGPVTTINPHTSTHTSFNLCSSFFNDRKMRLFAVFEKDSENKWFNSNSLNELLVCSLVACVEPINPMYTLPEGSTQCKVNSLVLLSYWLVTEETLSWTNSVRLGLNMF